MGKSLDFCKKRVFSGQVPLYSDRDFSLAVEREDTPDLFRYSVGFEDVTRFINLRAAMFGIVWKYSIYFDDNEDYDYFASQTSVHDGTLVFELNTIDEVISRIVNGLSYNNAKKPYDGCHIKYTVGNLVVINEFNEYGFGDLDDGGIKLMSRTTVMLPIKYEIIGTTTKEKG